VIAAPLSAYAAIFEAARPALASGDVLVTDVGSVKAEVCRVALSSLSSPEWFVGAHPLAGGVRPGPDAARETLFETRACVLTPTETTSAEALARARCLWQATGAHVVELSPEAHDAVVAITSHLPHASAFALAAAVAGAAPALSLAGFGGPGFWDATRIAAGDAAIWSEILLANRDAVAPLLDALRGELQALAKALAGGDRAALEGLIARAHAGRARVVP
jgi:prephenate dehydrogenase